MTCVKTGCHIYIIPQGVYAYGDAHEVDGVYFFRLVEESLTPLSEVLHYEVNGYAYWWDRCKDIFCTTLIVQGHDVLSYGYTGRALTEFPYHKEPSE